MTPATSAVDCQSHWYPPVFCAARSGAGTYPRCTREGDDYVFEVSEYEVLRVRREFHDLDLQLDMMRGAGIETVVSSPVVLGDVTALELGEARDLVAMLNETLAAMQAKYSNSFYGLAVLPLQDVEEALVALETAIGRLGLRGVLIHSNVDGASIARRELWPLYERIEQLGVPMFLHPTRACHAERVREYNLERPLVYMFDTTLAAMSLVVGGVVDAFPRLTIVHPHLGGTLPYLLERVEEYRRMGFWDVEKPIRAYLQRFYTDTVSGSKRALQQAVDVYGIDHVVFATDFPYFRADDAMRFVNDSLSVEDAHRVLTVNAQELLGVKGDAA
jgi:aminocarboxymuconate-semialdehyde decarboxylase